MNPCVACQQIDCINPEDFQTYSLESDAFFSPQFTFVVNCPPNYNCAPGTFPQTIVIPPGQFIIPGGVPSGGSSTFPVQLKCCSSTLSVMVPAGSTTDQINTIMMGLFLQCAEQQAMCNAINSPPPRTPVPQSQVPFTNDVLSVVVCAHGGTPKFSPPLPGNFLIIGTALIIVAGSVSSMISKSDANAQAQAQLNSVASTVSCVTDVFATMAWNNPPDSQGGTSSQNTFVGGNVIFSAPLNSDHIENQAFMPYTGATISCTATVTVVNALLASAALLIIVDNTGLLLIQSLTGLADGTYSYPFTLTAASVNVNPTVNFQNGGGGTASFHLVLTSP
jgi:hypothetical protein